MIRIVLSEELKSLHLEGLAEATGYIVEKLDFPERKNKGFIVCLDKKYEGEYNWFIPKDSVKHVE